MFVIDMVEAPMDTAPTVIVAESGQGKNNPDQQERSIGVCYVVSKGAEENLKNQVPVVPWSDVSRYFKYFEQRNINLPYSTGGHQDEVSSRVLQQPVHGALVEIEWHNGDTHYFYRAGQGYYGKDEAVILGDVNGHKVNIHVHYHVVPTRTFNMGEVCAETGLIWKISNYPGGQVSDMADLKPGLDDRFVDYEIFIVASNSYKWKTKLNNEFEGITNPLIEGHSDNLTNSWLSEISYRHHNSTVKPKREPKMFTPDMPPEIPTHDVPMMIAESNKDQSKRRVVGMCALIGRGEPGKDLFPIKSANIYFAWFERKEVGLEGSATLISGPEHGELIQGDEEA